MNRYLKPLNILKSYIYYISNIEHHHGVPVKLWLETTSRCNLACKLCVNKNLATSQKGDMGLPLFKSIVNQVKDYVYQINLFHRGEPLLHPQIIEMIKYANKSHLLTCIHTNATLLNENISMEILQAGLDKLFFSFDSYDKKEYETNKTGANYDSTVKNIINFLQIKKEQGFVKPYTVLQFMEYNNRSDSISSYDRIKKNNFLKNFYGLGLNKVVGRNPHNWGGSLNINNINKNILKEKPAQELTVYEGENKENINLFNKTIKCTFPWYSMTVFFNGKVFPCPQDFMGALEIGNLNYQSVKEVFNGEPLREIREKFIKKTVKSLTPCNKCDRIWRKTLAGLPLEYLKNNFNL